MSIICKQVRLIFLVMLDVHIHEITKKRVFFEDVPDDIHEMFTKI